MRTARSQEGLAGATVLIIIILAVLAIALGRGAFREEEVALDQRAVTDARLKKITDALVAYVVLNARLPCPAQGALDTGDAAPDAATTACTEADGVVPWKSLALRREDAVDGWGRKISYRVFDGPTGFTQAGGANMTNCNSSLGFPLDLTLDPGALCKAGAPPPNMPLQFFLIRGNMLVVEGAGTPHNGNAFVLVSHGDSGYGAFPSDGATGRTVLPDNAGREFRNTQATGTYWDLPRSAPGIPASDAAHFDDIVTYLGASELVARAKLAARPWSNFSLSAEYNLPAVSAAAPGLSGEDGGGNRDTGQVFLDIGGILVIATDSSPGARNVGVRTQDGITGIGVYNGGGGDLDSDRGERLIFQLGSGSEFQKMDIALNRFRVVQTSPTRLEERAEVSFRRGGDLLQASTVASTVEAIQPARCLFGLVSAAVFDRMDIRPLSRTGDGAASTFSVAAVEACSEATAPASCMTAIANAVDCPFRPPSAASTTASPVAATTATLKGFADDNGANTTVSFDYGTTCAYPSNAPASSPSLLAGTGTTAVTADITGLACNTSYYFRTKAVSGGGTTTGNNAMFTTAGCATPMPIATTSANGEFIVNPPGTPPLTFKTTLFGIVNDNGADTTVTFEYGFLNCYDSSVSSLPLPGTLTAGSGTKTVTAVIGDPLHPDTPTPALTCGTRYHFRVRAVSPSGTTTGSDKAFTTPPCL